MKDQKEKALEMEAAERIKKMLAEAAAKDFDKEEDWDQAAVQPPKLFY